MKLGIRAHDLGTFSNAFELAKKAKEYGFDCVQLILRKSLGEENLTKDLAEIIKRDFAHSGVEIKMLGAYFNIIDGKKTRDDIDYFKKNLKYAKYFGCSLVGSETGSYSKGRVYDQNTQSEEAYRTVLETVRELVNEAAKFGVFVAIEGAWYHVISDCQKMKRLIDDLNSPHLKVIFDLYNLVNLNNYHEQRKIIDEAFALYGDRIVLIHAKDFIVDKDDLKQVSLGKGIYDYPYLINKLKKEKSDITFIFEGVTGEESIISSYRYITDIINR